MARGMVVGEQIVSQAQTKAFDENWDRMKHADNGERGRFVWDPERRRLVRPGERESERAVDAPIMVGRCHEGQVAPDGTDISTRAKRAAWMKETGHADYSDYKSIREKAAAEKAAKARGEFKKDPALRDFIGRELYKRKMIL